MISYAVMIRRILLATLLFSAVLLTWVPVRADEEEPGSWKDEYAPMDDSWKSVKQELIPFLQNFIDLRRGILL